MKNFSKTYQLPGVHGLTKEVGALTGPKPREGIAGGSEKTLITYRKRIWLEASCRLGLISGLTFDGCVEGDQLFTNGMGKGQD